MPGFDLLNANEDARNRRGLDLAPPATSSGIIDDSAREVARGESLRNNAGETVTVPKADWVKALRIAGLALRDVGSSLQGRPTNFLLDAMMQEEQAGIRQQESGRAERRLSLDEQRGKREEQLFPLQQKAAQAQVTAAQMGNLKSGIDAFDLLSRRSADGTPEQKQAALNEALKIHRGLGLEDIVPETMVRNLMNRPDLLASLTKYKPYLDQMPPGVLAIIRQAKVDDPKELKGLFETLDHLVGRQAEMDALTTATRAIGALKAGGKTGPFTSADLQMAFLDKPFAFEKLESDAVAGRLAPDYVPGKTMLKAQEAGAVRPSPATLGQEEEAKTAGELRAKQKAGVPLAGPGTVEERIATLRAKGPAGEKQADAIRKEIDATIAKKDTLKDVDLRGAVLGQARQLVAADFRSKPMTAEQRERVVQETARSIAEKDYQRADLFPKLAPLPAADQAKREQRIPVDVARQAMKDAGGNKEEAKKLLRQRGFDPKWPVR